jgi:hypothetical protein
MLDEALHESISSYTKICLNLIKVHVIYQGIFSYVNYVVGVL